MSSSDDYVGERHRTLYTIWIAVILLIVVPWSTFQGHPHWQYVGWVPFVSPPFPFRDVVLNTLLFMPFGYWRTKLAGYSRVEVSRTLAFPFALSVGAEVAQIFSHGRFASATDVTCNLAGTIWGTCWARRGAGHDNQDSRTAAGAASGRHKATPTAASDSEG